MRLNEYSFDFKEKIFPKSIKVNSNGTHVYRPRILNIEECTDKIMNMLSDIAPHKLYKVINADYLTTVLVRTHYLDKYKVIDNVWNIGETIFIYEKNLGIFTNDNEKIFLAHTDKDNFKTDAYRVFMLGKRLGGEEIKLIIGPTKFRERIDLGFQIAKAVNDCSLPLNRGWNISGTEDLSEILKSSWDKGTKTYYLTGEIIEDAIKEYQRFGTFKQLDINKLLIKNYDEETINKIRSIRLEELYLK